MGNDTLTGGLFGFEGSIVCSILVTLFALALMLYYRKKEQALLAAACGTARGYLG